MTSSSGTEPVPQLDEGIELTSATVDGGRLIVDDATDRYRIYRLDAPMQPGDERKLTFETLR